MPDIDSIFFDITTSAQWRGHPVGIIRVERELASRARTHLGDRLFYCVYDKRAGDFKIVKDEYVPGILAGYINIDFESAFHVMAPDNSRRLRKSIRNIAVEIPVFYRLLRRLRGQNVSREEAEALRQQIKPHLATGPHGRKLKTRLRNIALEIPIAYQAAQRLRGRRLSLNQIRLIRQQYELLGTGPADISTLPMSVATSSSVALSKRVAIVSAGADWQHKEIQQIYRLREQSGFKFISVIYDLIPWNLPHYVVPSQVNLLTEYFGELLWTSDGCLCISETSRLDFIEFCNSNGVSPPKAIAFPLGSDLQRFDIEPDVVPRPLQGKKFVLFVSTIEPRKNHRMVYEAWCHALLNGTVDSKDCRLVFVGMSGWNTNELLYEIRENPLTRETVVVMSNVPDGVLASLYRNATFVIFPSFYEGFGLPLAEALGYGKVCVTSGAGALKEIGTGLRVDIDPRDTLGWAKKMAELLNDSSQIARMESNIKQSYRKVSWDESADAFFTSLGEILT